MICPRCTKSTDDVHTCTPTELVAGMEAEIERLRSLLARMVVRNEDGSIGVFVGDATMSLAAEALREMEK